MAKAKKAEQVDERTIPTPGTEATPELVAPTGPLSNGGKLRVARRVIAAIEDLDPAMQRGVVGIVGLAGDGAHADALRRVLTILAGVALEQDRKDVVRSVSAIVGSAASVLHHTTAVAPPASPILFPLGDPSLRVGGGVDG